jgi:hypothetical protein
MRGCPSFKIHLRSGHSAAGQLVDAEWIFQTQHVRTPELSGPKGLTQRSRQTYRVSTVFKSSAITSPHTQVAQDSVRRSPSVSGSPIRNPL